MAHARLIPWCPVRPLELLAGADGEYDVTRYDLAPAREPNADPIAIDRAGDGPLPNVELGKL